MKVCPDEFGRDAIDLGIGHDGRTVAPVARVVPDESDELVERGVVELLHAPAQRGTHVSEDYEVREATGPVVTAANIDAVRETMLGSDQAERLEIGCETWPIYYRDGQRGQMTIWPAAGRGAVHWGGPSAWGEWDAATRLLTLHSGETVDSAGQIVDETAVEPS
jgi:hypothetical protein